MALDFVILGDDGSPAASISIDEATHWELTLLAREIGCVLFSRFSDYYEDAAISADELDSFMLEIDRLRTMTEAAAARTFLAALQELSIQAKAEHKPLESIAD